MIPHPTRPGYEIVGYTVKWKDVRTGKWHYAEPGRTSSFGCPRFLTPYKDDAVEATRDRPLRKAFAVVRPRRIRGPKKVYVVKSDTGTYLATSFRSWTYRPRAAEFETHLEAARAVVSLERNFSDGAVTCNPRILRTDPYVPA